MGRSRYASHPVGSAAAPGLRLPGPRPESHSLVRGYPRGRHGRRPRLPRHRRRDRVRAGHRGAVLAPKAPHQGAWTFALALFALASAALATAASTGWDRGTFRAFYLLGAVLNVPWLALGTVYLLGGRKLGDRVRTGLVLFTGFAIGVMLAAPIHGVIAPTGGIPVGKDHFGVAAARAGRRRQRRRRDRGVRRRGVLGGPLRARAGVGHRVPRGRQRARSRSAPSCCRAAGCCRAWSVRTRRSRSRSRRGSW